MSRSFRSFRSAAVIAVGLIGSIIGSASSAFAQTCPFEDGNSVLTREGLVLTRYSLGLRGADLVANSGFTAAEAPVVEATILCPSCGLDINGNGAFDTVDATIISRKLAGLSGDALTDGLALGGGSRNTPVAVQSFLTAGCGATGGTVTSVSAGTGLTGGTFTTSGTIAADTSYLQRRVGATCAAGSSIRAIAADGTVTCQADTSGGSGTVSNVATGAGLTGGPITATGTIGLAATQLLPTTACANNQIAKWSGSAWICASETGGGSGTVTNVATGAGLTGGPITATGTIGLAATQLLPIAACANNQIAKWDGSAWGCANDTPGTLVGVLTGTGLSGGPITSLGTINIEPTFRLPQTCSANQLARYNATVNLWECFTPSAVTNIATGLGLTGGPITATGTLAADTAYLQRRVSAVCASGSSIRAIAADGTVTCQTDTSGSGTVTSVSAGTGLTGGPITAAGTIAADTTYLQRRVSSSCAPGSSIRVIAADGTVTCQVDSGSGGGGTVTSVATGPGLTGGPITASGTVGLAASQLLPTTSCSNNQIPKWSGGAWVCANEAGAAAGWVQGGNAYGVPGVVGTTDAQPLSVQSGGDLVSVVIAGGNGLRISKGLGFSTDPPNVINGSSANGLIAGSVTSDGVVVAGGGYPSSFCTDPDGQGATTNCRNEAGGSWSVVGGGFANAAVLSGAVVGGGSSNRAQGTYAVIAGGKNNQTNGSGFATVSGGLFNQASGYTGVVSGGSYNLASGEGSSIAGGTYGRASYSSQQAMAGGRFAATGDAQTSLYVYREQTTSAATVTLRTDPFDRGVRVALNQALAFDILVVARNDGTSTINTEMASFQLKGLIANTAGAFSVVGVPIKTVIAATAGAASWDVNAVASLVYAGLAINANGAAGVNIRWVATVRTSEVSW